MHLHIIYSEVNLIGTCLETDLLKILLDRLLHVVILRREVDAFRHEVAPCYDDIVPQP